MPEFGTVTTYYRITSLATGEDVSADVFTTQKVAKEWASKNLLAGDYGLMQYKETWEVDSEKSWEKPKVFYNETSSFTYEELESVLAEKIEEAEVKVKALEDSNADTQDLSLMQGYLAGLREVSREILYLEVAKRVK